MTQETPILLFFATHEQGIPTKQSAFFATTRGFEHCSFWSLISYLLPVQAGDELDEASLIAACSAAQERNWREPLAIEQAKIQVFQILTKNNSERGYGDVISLTSEELDLSKQNRDDSFWFISFNPTAHFRI